MHWGMCIIECRGGEPNSADSRLGMDEQPKSRNQAPTPLSADMMVDNADFDALSAQLSDIAAKDNYFDPAGFLGGAKAAFDMIMSAFADGDRDTLSSLVSKEVFSAFEGAIRQREEQNQTLGFMIFEEPVVKFSEWIAA